MKFKQHMRVDEDQNIVTITEVTQTPEEFLQANSQVYGFAQAMKPGARIERKEALLLEVEK